MCTRIVTGLLVAGLLWVACSATAAPALGEAEPAGAATSGTPPGHAAEQGGPELNPLTWQRDLAFWTGVVFLVLLAVLWKFAWGPIAQGLDRREQAVADQIAHAEQANSQAEQRLAEYERKLADSQEEVRGILERARRDAERLGHQMLEKAKQDAQAEHARAVEQIDAATANALKELARQSSTLAVELAGRIVRAELKPEDHAQLIQQAIRDFAQESPRRRSPSAN